MHNSIIYYQLTFPICICNIFDTGVTIVSKLIRFSLRLFSWPIFILLLFHSCWSQLEAALALISHKNIRFNLKVRHRIQLNRVSEITNIHFGFDITALSVIMNMYLILVIGHNVIVEALEGRANMAQEVSIVTIYSYS